MNILYLSTAAFPSEITHTLSMLRVCKAMAEQGHTVAMTGRRLNNTQDSAVFDYYGLPSSFDLHLERVSKWLDNRWTRPLLLPGLFLAARFRRAIKRHKPDLVYSRLTLAELLAVPREIPLIYEMHSPGELAGTRFRRWVFTTLMKRLNVQHIVVTTDTLKRYLEQELPGIAVRVARLSAERPEKATDAEREQFREHTLQGQNFEFHAGYTGFLHEVRGIGVVIRAASLSPDVAFHIVGGTPDAVAEWKGYAKAQDVPDNVFFYGHQPASTIPMFLECFDVFLAPLQKPKQPLTFMSPLKVPQYLAYGKPIIASDVLPHQQQMVAGETALFAAPDSEHEWAHALERLKNEPELRVQLATNATAYYNAELTPERRLNKILEGVGTGG